MDAHRRTLRVVGAMAVVVVLAGCSGADGQRTTERSTAARTGQRLPRAGRPGRGGRGSACGSDRCPPPVPPGRRTAAGRGAADLVGRGPRRRRARHWRPGPVRRPRRPARRRARPGGALDFPVVAGRGLRRRRRCRRRPSSGCATRPAPSARSPSRSRTTAGRRLHESDCFDEGLLQQVAVEVVDVAEVAGPALQATVRLRRVAGTDRVRVTRVDSNTVYDITAVGGLPTLDGQGAVTGVLRLNPGPVRRPCARRELPDQPDRPGRRVGDREPHTFVLTPDPGPPADRGVRRQTCRAGGN